MKRVRITGLMYKILLIILVGIFAYFLIFSDIGFFAHERAKKELVAKQQELVALKKEIVAIEQEINDWKTDSFELEKVARQDLCMGYTDEIIYLLPEQN